MCNQWVFSIGYILVNKTNNENVNDKNRYLQTLIRNYLSELLFPGQDVVKKLAGLNSKRFTERGFHYDIRLPCVISLRDDVEGRERRIMSQMTPNQAGTI